MQIIDNLVISAIGDDYIVVPTGQASIYFRGIIRLNSTGADIFRGLQDGLSIDDIAARLVDEYEGV